MVDLSPRISATPPEPSTEEPRTCPGLSTTRPALECRWVEIADPCSRLPNEQAFSLEDGSLYAFLARFQSMPMAQRLECISRRFLDIPYRTDPLGEGPAADVDADPLFRFDALDCMTFIEEVMALSSADTFETFFESLQAIRYRSGLGVYAARNHFVSADWLPQNVTKGLLRDETSLVGQRETRRMEIIVDRAGWVLEKTGLSFAQQSGLLDDLFGMRIDRPERIGMSYVPTEAFFTAGISDAEPREEIVSRMPEVSIAIFLRQPAAAEKLGVLVAHMGWLIVPMREDGSRGTPILRHASSQQGAVVDEPFLPYLASQETYRAGVTIVEPVAGSQQR